MAVASRVLSCLVAVAVAASVSVSGGWIEAGASPSKLSSAVPCASHVVDGVLPAWARSGFSDPKPRMPYEVGGHGEIAAIFWGFPLLAPPPRTHNNKILWVSKAPPTKSSALQITAQRMMGSRKLGLAVHREVTGGPGPSIINLPAAGCWRLGLHWSGHSDSLDLSYLPNPSA